MLSVVIPTRDRSRLLMRTLDRLAHQQPPACGFEVIVVDNGSSDDTAEIVPARAADFPAGLTFLVEPQPGPAAARNSGVRAAAGEVILFLGDDMEPRDDRLLIGHGELHAQRRDHRFAVLGRVAWHPGQPITPFMRWLESGRQFAFHQLSRGPVAAEKYFYTSNVSLKRELFLAAGGFDERFPFAAVEDIELGIRLAGLGMELEYEPDLLVLHYHPTTLESSLRRAVVVGRSAALFHALQPDYSDTPWRVPSRPSWSERHLPRLILRVLADLPGVPFRARRRAWNLLHAAAFADGYRLGPP